LNVALVFGYGQKDDGEIDEQTRDRCFKAAELYHKGEIRMIYLTVSASKNGVSMAMAMGEFLLGQGVDDRDIVIERRGGNTAGELDVFLGLASGQDCLWLISTWYHLPRILWLALWRLPWKKFRLAVAWRHAHFKDDVLKEFAKIANAILRPRKSAKVF